MLDKTEYSKESKTYKLVQFTVEQLGFPQGATTEEIYAKAQELGLDELRFEKKGLEYAETVKGDGKKKEVDYGNCY